MSGKDTTLSQRTRRPAWSTPGVPTGMNTAGVSASFRPGVPSTMVGMSVVGGVTFGVMEAIQTSTSPSPSPSIRLIA